MNLKVKSTELIQDVRQHPRQIVLALVCAFVLNVLSFVFAIANSRPPGTILGLLFTLIFVWPIALIAYGIARLRRGKSADETEVKNRRAIVLKYFAIGGLLLLAILIAFWRYIVEVYGYHPINQVSSLIVFIAVLAGLFVIIVWHWIKYSENKLSAHINRASIHYLFSAITLVIILICYIAYSDMRDEANTNRITGRGFVSDYYSSIMVTFQSVAWIGVFVAIGSAILGYLRPSEFPALVNDQTSNRLDTASDRSALSSDRIESSSESEHLSEISSSFRADNIRSLVDTLKSTNARLETLFSPLTVSPHSSMTSDLVAERVGLIRGRLTRELKELTKRGNLNLTIGILTTIGAASALFWGLIATQPAPNETETLSLLRHYLPRILFAIFIEVFSFFFLRLYKNSLEDIKYYHNELTNLDSRLLALEIAARDQISDALTPIPLGLLNTDRNFVLKSGESTVEIERIKAEQQYMRTLIDTISTKLPDLGTSKKDANKS